MDALLERTSLTYVRNVSSMYLDKGGEVEKVYGCYKGTEEIEIRYIYLSRYVGRYTYIPRQQCSAIHTISLAPTPREDMSTLTTYLLPSHA